MTSRDRTLLLKVVGDTADASRALKSLDRNVSGFRQSMGKMAKAAAVGFGISEGIQFLGDSVKAASDLDESINAVRVTFGEASDTILDFSSDTTDAVFEVESELNQMAAVTGALLQNFGFNAQEAADWTVTLTKRAADMASTYNTDVGSALAAINSGLRGQSEPLTNFASDVRVAALEAHALDTGLLEAGEQMDANTKVAATLSKIMADTARTHGDAANTADSFANRQRQLREQFEAQKVALGEQLLPLMADLQEIGLKLLPVFADIIERLKPLIGLVGDLASGFSAVMDVLPVVNTTGGDTENMFSKLFDPIDGLLTPTGMLVNGWDALTGLWRDESIPTGEAIGGMAATVASQMSSTLIAATHELRQGTDDVIESQEELAEVLLAAADPAYNLQKAFTDFDATLNEVYADGILTTDEVFRLSRASLKLQDAQEKYDASDTITGLQAIAEHGRVDIEVLEGLFGWMQSIDGKRVDASVIIDVTGVDPGAFAPRDLPGGGSGGGGPVIPLHRGGIALGPTLALIGEAGPEAVVPLDGSGGIGSNTYNLYVTAGISDPAAVSDAVIEAIDRYERSNGTTGRSRI